MRAAIKEFISDQHLLQNYTRYKRENNKIDATIMFNNDINVE